MNYSENLSPEYTFWQRMARASVFPSTAKEQPWMFSLITKMRELIPGYTNPRAKLYPKGHEIDEEFMIHKGGQSFYITSLDRKAKIHTMTLGIKDFEENLNIKFKGASWQRVTIDETKEVFAIIPPKAISSEWENFKDELAKKFHWEKKTVFIEEREIEIIVTSGNVKKIADPQGEIVFHSNSPYESMERLNRWAGLFFGLRRDICIYNPRGTGKSEGTPSETGFNCDISAVYDEISKNYAPNKIIATGVCGGNIPLVYLMSMTHQLGIRMIIENALLDLRDGMGISSKFLDLTGLKSNDIESRGVIETGYNHGEYLKDLEGLDLSAMIVIDIKNDNLVTNGTKIFDVFQRLRQNAHHIEYTSPLLEGQHFDRFFYYPEVSQNVAEILFSKES